ncbi:hypothetical protein PCANB_000613 [Pneumocystis canis]|nr:hypothetical protein PCANB_000613 [Pneumocystis canis]
MLISYCLGSVIFVFEAIKLGKNIRYLHFGDFRASLLQIPHPAIKNKHFDLLYLDTRYFGPKYLFLSQKTVIDAVIELCKILNNNTINDNFSKKLIGTYIIGKEKLALEIVCSLKSKIYINQHKQKVISCLENKKLSSLFTNSPKEASVRLVSFKNMSKLETYEERRVYILSKFRLIDFSNIHTTIKNWEIFYDYTMIKPTKDSTYISTFYLIPYSEHSSFKKFICFCFSVDVDKILPTVNIHTQKSRDSMEKWVNLLENQKKNTIYFYFLIK